MVTTQTLNRQILLKLLIAAVMMFGFGYALVPMYKALCEVTGINVVTNKNDYGVRAFSPNKVGNTQVNYARTVTIEFDSNSRGPFTFKPVKNFLEVHPGEMTEIVYEVTNNLGRVVRAQAIPSYAPKQAEAQETFLGDGLTQNLQKSWEEYFGKRVCWHQTQFSQANPTHKQ